LKAWASAPRFVTLNETTAGSPDDFDNVNANSLGFPAVTVTTGAAAVRAAEAVQQPAPTQADATQIANVHRQPMG